MKQYTNEELLAMEKNADKAILAMTVTGVGIGFAPVGIDISALLLAMGTGVLAIGRNYGMSLSKEDAAELIKIFFKAAGTTFSIVTGGEKLAASLLKSNPVTYLTVMIIDGVMGGAAAFAVGYTSRRYFRMLAEGKKASKAEIGAWMREGKKQGKGIAKNLAEKKAGELAC